VSAGTKQPCEVRFLNRTARQPSCGDPCDCSCGISGGLLGGWLGEVCCGVDSIGGFFALCSGIAAFVGSLVLPAPLPRQHRQPATGNRQSHGHA
jgi:hypothetical protein